MPALPVSLWGSLWGPLQPHRLPLPSEAPLLCARASWTFFEPPRSFKPQGGFSCTCSFPPSPVIFQAYFLQSLRSPLTRRPLSRSPSALPSPLRPDTRSLDTSIPASSPCVSLFVGPHINNYTGTRLCFQQCLKQCLARRRCLGHFTEPDQIRPAMVD